ncbi:MAG: 2-C-methyl-D-erythritol 2,4-cyclodiphosphate synthase [Clostridia bacterium]|nr:2-C-methyl-D-erythritol 2,4-cyclodiphosphate synthase [Clostridia bacterium]
MRIGHGYDVHRLVEGRALILGGVNIPFEKGLLGHSDADVLTHALMDAMLGAAGLGDIGKHFPDTDPQYKGVDSLVLLAHVKDLLQKNGYCLMNADITLIAQKPKVASYLPMMKEKLAQTLQCDLSQLNIKATTEEHLGFTGEGAGMACHAVCLIDDNG